MKITLSYTRNLLALACLAALAAPAMADDNAAAADAKKAANLETVTVTGSRISNPNVISPTPISTLTAADIKATGAVNIGDVLTTLPQLATTFTMGNSNRFIGTAGESFQDLRNLGTSRTLVLVNGRRFVGASAGDTAVDVNLIPADWVERVEIITGGASAVYGADAVTGVVNFILKKNYQGANLHAQLGTSEHGNFNKGLVSLTGGMNFADNRGNIAGSVEHSEQDDLMFGDRFGHKAYASILTPNGPYDATLYPNGGGYTNYAGGTFSTGSSTDISKRYVFNPDGSVRHQNFYGPYDNTGRCSDCDRTDVNQVLQLQPKYKRTTLSGVASFDITPEQHLYAEGTYSHVDVTKSGQPAFGSGSSAYVITRDNAYIDPTLAAVMDANKLKSIKVSRFDLDAGLRGEDTKRNTARGVIGANGVITGDWEYDASLVYGWSDETRHNLNNRINDRFYASIDAVKDAKGNIVCRSTLNPNSVNPNAHGVLDPIALGGGCVPTSIFGAGAINPAAAQWFNTTTTTTSRLTQFVGGGTITNNNLFQMPFEAGAASLVGGVEFRRESSRQITDPLDVAGLTFLNAIPPSSGAYNVKEGYIETAMPLLSNRPFAQNLTFDAAARFSDYSTIGHTKTWRWGLDWAIDGNVRLRGTVSSAVRAPNIGELFGGQSQNYFTITDPCSAKQIKNGPDPSVRAANCAALGIPAGWTSSNTATISGISGSNPDLKPEQGRTWTGGIVLTPEFLPGFGVTADYWNIKLTDAISAPSGTDIANHCVDSTTGINNIYCANAQRGPDHELNFINSINQNISSLSTSGVDIGAYYSHEVGPGKLGLNLDVTKVIAYTEHPFQDDPSNTVQDNGTLGFPKWKGVLRTTYTMNNWLFNWTTRYFSSMLRVSNESYESNPYQMTPIKAGAGFFNDVRASYTFGKSGWQAYAGITNVFDRDPPVNIFGNSLGGGLYDTIGRAYYAGFNYNF
ncbi:TonB-dependent Receptor Plug Domain [Dyella jiangningensis]|uniref:TonB-dependent receptor domain-containing protein n=2 Tax=Gammaproteobacteria TaxID=1236 RepID=UPI00088B7EEE|nr:TonB-dependent receptor [Dyella sp. AtDHG13]PXV59147.1 TonB-dependent receptor-like protein [Dyella sp. AtDHG13]SDK23903.1 TonB-dependent Receptor Plug Domain [Dyella jiangningensis]